MENNNLTFYLKAELINIKNGERKYLDHYKIYGSCGAAAIANYESELHAEGEYYMSDSYSYYQAPVLA